MKLNKSKFNYQVDNLFFAQVGGDLETLAEEEIISLGGTNTNKSFRGIYFNADFETIYNINYNSRFVTRVLAPLASFKCQNASDLRYNASKIEWDKILSLEKTFAISSTVIENKGFTNSLYAAQLLKDIIADYFREIKGKRPDVDKDNPDVRFNIFLDHTNATISLDTSGESLHKRGYRMSGGEAPIKETVAAAIIKYSGWNGETPLLDPMCGSGTLLCEALMSYCNMPSQYLKKHFGFMNLPEFDEALWKSVKDKSDQKIREIKPGLISGSDNSDKAVNASLINLKRLPFGDMVKIEEKAFQDIPQFEDGIIVTNPPYGIRIGTLEEVKELLNEFGNFIKHKCNGSSAFVYVGEKELRKYIGLKPAKKINLSNGVLEGQLLRIDSFKGKYADMKREQNKE